MAIPYPYNRLGINAGGTITPIEPIEGSQGVFIYNSYGSVVSSAMQVVNKNLVVESAKVWSNGMLINPKINSYQAAYIFTEGTALNVSLVDSASLVVSGGYVKNVDVPINTNLETPYSNRISVIGGVVSDVNFHGYRAYVYLDGGGEIHNFNYTVFNNNSLDIYSAKLFNMSVFNDSAYRLSNSVSGSLAIYVYSGAYIDGVYREQRSNANQSRNYIDVNISSNASDITLLNFNVGSLGNFIFRGVPSNAKLTGTYTGGSFWLSNNTFHNFYLNPGYGLTLLGSNSVSFDSFLLESGAYLDLDLDNVSCYYNGNNITKRHNARLGYPYTFNDAFTIGGITDEKGSFGYSNGSGSNIVFGGNNQGYSINLNSGFIVYPFFSTAYCFLSSGTFISLGFFYAGEDYYRGSVHLQNGGYILNNDPNSMGGAYIFEDFSYTNVRDSNLSSIWIYSPTWSRGMTNVTIGINDSIYIQGSECSIHNLVHGSGAVITLDIPLFPSYSSVSNNATTVYSDWRVIEGTNANGTFKLSNGTFTNPAIYGSVYSSHHIYVGNRGLVSGGIVYNVTPYNISRGDAGIRVGNGGTVSGVTICSGGAVYANIASYGAAPSIINVLQASGGNVYPNGSYIVYDTRYYDTSSNGLDPVINGINDYGSFYLTSGTLHNWAIYGSYNAAFNLTLHNFTNSIHALDTAHFIGYSAGCTCYAYRSAAGDASASFLTDIKINSLYLKDSALLSVYYYTNAISINAVYVENAARISGGRSTGEAGLLTFNLLDYASLNSGVYNELNGAGIMHYTSLVVNANQNVGLYNASGDNLIVNSGGLVILETNNSFTSANIVSGGYLQVYNVGQAYNNNIKGNNERGLFMISGSYASNLIWGAPPNRSQFVSLTVNCSYALLNDCVVTNNNVMNVSYMSLANMSVYNATLTCRDSTNKITYIYVGNGGYVYCDYANNASYLFVEDGTIFGTRSNALNNITVNSNGSCMFYYSNAVTSAEVNSSGEFYLGGRFTLINGTRSDVYTGSWNNGSFINVQSDGTLHVGYACVAYSARVNLGGTLIVSSGGSAVSLISNGGANVVSMAGAYITYDSQ